jgi:hypothetical protein
MDAPRESGKYVYCIIRSGDGRRSFGNIGFSGAEVYTLDYRDVAPVMSDTPLKKFDVRDEDVSLHKNVVQRVMEEHGVIPVAYGMSFKNKKTLLIALSAGYQAMKKAMKVVEDKVELGVKVLADKDTPPGEGDRIRAAFMESLKAKAAETKELKRFSDRLLLNASFLVSRSGVEGFSEEVERLRRQFEGMRMLYSGPWPPYNFVDIHILSKRRGGFR